jgi:Predicted transcriptional regulators
MATRPHKRNYDTLKQIGRRLAAAREARGLTQAEVSRALGCKPNTWSVYESGRRMPDPELMAKFADRFGITCDWVYRGVRACLPHDIASRIAPDVT